MSQFINTEAMESAAYRMRDAAIEANRAADRLETVLHQLRMLTEDGYGNNVTRLIELLSKGGGKQVSTPIEIVKEMIALRETLGMKDNRTAALASVLADAERFKALERIHDDVSNPLGFGVVQNYYGRKKDVEPLAELADRLREGAK